MKFNKKEYNKKYYLKNIKHEKERTKKWRLKNPEYKKEWNLKNKDHIQQYEKEYRLKNKEQLQDNYCKNAEYIKEQHKEYRRRPGTKELKRDYLKNKYKTASNFRLVNLCRNRIWRALKGEIKSASTMELIGCTVDDLRRHLESKFEPWMTWANYGLWDIDHIKACAKFDLTDPEQQHACFNWSNLQPMEHIENIKKGAR